jgi:hypothetical protein
LSAASTRPSKESSSGPGSTSGSGGRSSTSGDAGSAGKGNTGSPTPGRRTRRAGTSESTTKLTRIFELIDFENLPAETLPIARMLTDGLTQTEIAMSLGRSEDWVASRIRELRLALIEQALSRADELDSELRAHVERLHLSIASAAGARIGKRRTV